MTGFQNRNRLNIRLGAMAKSVRPTIRRALKNGGLRIENEAVAGIIDPPKTGHVYPSKHRKGATHQASAPGQFPAADSGELHQSITTAVVEDSERAVVVQTAANTPYATRLEYGGSHLAANGKQVHIAPRPYMTPSFNSQREIIKDHVTLAVTQEIRRQSRGRK